MELYEQIELQECPICGGAGLMAGAFTQPVSTAARTQRKSATNATLSGWTQPSAQRICGTSARF